LYFMLAAGDLLGALLPDAKEKEKDVVLSRAGRLEPYAIGQDITLAFARLKFVWTPAHTPGKVLDDWERMGDAADRHMQPVAPRTTGLPSFEVFLERLRSDAALRIDPMPEWMDMALLDDGMRFFVEAWPLVFLSFGWAVVGGFGCESASAVLLESRYWAESGERGRRDTWRRLRETACWLFDICAPGAQAFAAGGSAWEAALHIRYLHARTRADLAAKHPGGSGFAAEWGVAISQLQLVGTLLGSSVLLLQGMERAMGVALRPRDKEGFVHLWRVIGHLFGIDEVKNPNTSYAAGCVAMESVFAYAIPAAPRPQLTHALTSHIYKAVGQGFYEDHGMPVNESLLAAQARLYLGQPYGDAIGLPAVAWYHTALALVRLSVFRLFYLPYFLFHGRGEATSLLGRAGAALHGHVVRVAYRVVMRRSFAALVHSVRARQPACRFGKCLDADRLTEAQRGRRPCGADPSHAAAHVMGELGSILFTPTRRMGELHLSTCRGCGCDVHIGVSKA